MKDQLEVEMKKAAAAQDFEKAADLRDLIRDLKETTKKERKIRARALHAAAGASTRRTIWPNWPRFSICPRRRSASKVSTSRTSAARSPWRRW